MNSLKRQKFVNYICNKNGERIYTSRTRVMMAIGETIFIDGSKFVVIEVDETISILKNVRYIKVVVEMAK